MGEGKTLVIAEKRSVGKTIAAFLGCRADRGGWVEGPKFDVTWAQGHLLRLLMPDEYDDQPRWRERGADALLDLLGFDDKLAKADVVVTGEGCFDAQSLRGKVVTSVARRCKAAGKPLVAFVGTMDDALVEVGHTLGVTTFAVVNPPNRPLEDVVRHPRARLSRLALAVGEALAADGELPGVVGPLPDPDPGAQP